jgi:hypothetical protein
MRHLLDVSAARNNLEGLPAVTAVAAISAASTTTAMAAATTAATTTTTSTAISAATAPTAATTTLSLRPRFIHDEVSPAEILSVKRVYGLVGVFVVGDFDEGEAA